MDLERVITKSFNKACVEYRLIADGDKILVGLSGGKDSLMLLRLLAVRSRIYRPKISVEAIHVIMDNVPYCSDMEFLNKYCDELNVPLHIIHTSFDDSSGKSKCFMCSWNRRKTIFNFAEENDFNKVALGHHQDDFMVTFLMNLSFEGRAETMLPLMRMNHYALSVIRPLCLVREDDIRDFAANEEWEEQITRCPYEDFTQRKKIGDMLENMLSLSPEVRYNIWHSIEKLSSNK
jgi:tRNA(Ile)-lysidine synthase TilS/MesJ